MSLAQLYACASRLLLNPGTLSASDLEPCTRVPPAPPADGLRRAYDRLLKLMATDPLGLEEKYIGFFELAPKCPLHVTHYMARDERERVALMLRIASIYRSAGLVIRGELPDYLPAILEFLSIAGNGARRLDLIRAVLPGVRALLDCARGFEPYHTVLRTVVELMERELGVGGS